MDPQCLAYQDLNRETVKGVYRIFKIIEEKSLVLKKKFNICVCKEHEILESMRCSYGKR